ncbi:Transmembrane protein 138 [Strongyloides ratti]|uniref:Transmembrane protein 138 n=1 Tax=Strongyloides ratti TaxID=34506 RepID=A0A090L3H6_STRRB|nr:Transmembrane protein 138 [Strongyloides ratti]CEF62049.1 Transmembrane protein 138 [Strongyloides ratti]
MLFIIQNVCTVMGIIVLVISFVSTFIFQAGLIKYLIVKFKNVIIISIIYLAVSITTHTITLRSRWYNKEKFIWSYELLSLYVIHRTVAIFYYYSYKKAALILGDPKFYNDNSWLRDKIRYDS